MTALLLAHGDMVRDLARAVIDGPRGVRGVRNLVFSVVRDEAWRDFIAPGTGEHFTYGPDEFARFVQAPPFGGLGADLETIRALCAGDTEAARALRAATADIPLPAQGRPMDNLRNANNIPTTGQTSTYNLRRLKRDRPDLAELVICGELSAHAAAIEAGFRKPPTPATQVRAAWRKLTAAERAAFLAEVAPD